MTVRVFAEPSNTVTLALGAMGFAMGPGTVAAIYKRATDTTNESIFNAGDGGSTGWKLSVEFDDVLMLRVTASNLRSVFTCLTADGWMLLAASKPAANPSTARLHKYVFSTGIWTHEEGVSSQATSTVPVTSNIIGETPVGTHYMSGKLAVIGAWDYVLTDLQLEGMTRSLFAWRTLSPKGLWPMNQAVRTTPITDITGNGADETALLATTVDTADDPPGFSFSDPPFDYSQFPKAKLRSAVPVRW